MQSVSGQAGGEDQVGQACREGDQQPRHWGVGSKIIVLLVAVLLVLAVLAGWFISNKSESTDPSCLLKAPAPPKAANSESYRALQAVVTKPQVVDQHGGVIVSRDGVGHGLTGIPTVEIYGDFLCPDCSDFHLSIGPTLTSLVKAGQINVVYHCMDFLNRLRSDAYSSRTASAILTVAERDPDHLLELIDSFYQKDFQPSEDTKTAVSDERLAARMRQVGVPRDVAKRAADGEYVEWVHKLNAYTLTRQELKHPTGAHQGTMTTPTVVINNVYWDDEAVDTASKDLRKNFLQSIGLASSDVGKADKLPLIAAGYQPLAQSCRATSRSIFSR